jgi:hypothetical protein
MNTLNDIGEILCKAFTFPVLLVIAFIHLIGMFWAITGWACAFGSGWLLSNVGVPDALCILAGGFVLMAPPTVLLANISDSPRLQALRGIVITCLLLAENNEERSKWLSEGELASFTWKDATAIWIGASLLIIAIRAILT